MEKSASTPGVVVANPGARKPGSETLSLLFFFHALTRIYTGSQPTPAIGFSVGGLGLMGPEALHPKHGCGRFLQVHSWVLEELDGGALSSTLNPKPETLNPKPETLNPKP